MLDATGYLRDFVEQMTQLNRGRAFFTTPETLGDYVLVDFLDQKRARRRSGVRPDLKRRRRICARVPTCSDRRRLRPGG